MVSVTKRFVGLAAAGLCLVAAAWLVNLQAYVFVFYNLLLLAAWALDYTLTPKQHMLTVRREENDRLYFKTDNKVSFFIRNGSRQPLKIQAADDTVRHFSVNAKDLCRTVLPNEEGRFSYTVLPVKRGSFLFQHIYIRYNGLLGLCVKYKQSFCPKDFKVYPNLQDLSRYRLMTQKNRLLPQGERTLRLYGAGSEFESLRTYVEGDDYRKINWTATARESRLIVNQYQTEKNQPVFILLDAGRPMSYASGGYKKLDHAVNAALILADIVNQQGDQCGLMVFDDAIRTQIMPGKGAAHRNTLMEALYHVEDNRLTSDYESAFFRLCERQKRRSLVFIFTDFEILEEAESLITHIALLKKRHIPIVVFMKNESLAALTEQPIYDRQDEILKDTAMEFLNERKKIFRTLNAMRIPNIESTAERFASAAVNKYLSISRQY